MSDANTIRLSFHENSDRNAFDSDLRRKIEYNISRYDQAVMEGKMQFKDYDTARKRASMYKLKVINNLDGYLIEFEKHFEERGGKIIWAVDALNAVKEILKILKSAKAKFIVKSKSMVTEEIGLNQQLERKEIEVVETDLGEFIVQQRNEAPYHIVTPAMHLSKKDVADLFSERFNLKNDSSPEEITAFVRKLLKEKFLNADVGVTGANFLIADTGSVAITENEGNAYLSATFPKIHIVVAGIEKIIPSLSNLGLFWPLLAANGTGQNITVYNSIISGPRQEGERDGPEQMFLILLDNKRSEILSRINQRKALTCIRCGACLNACPVYKTIGGHTYGTTYSGPIGAVLTPYFKGMSEYRHLSFASTLCGKCTEVCPVNINLHELLLYIRNESIVQKTYKSSEKWSMTIFKNIVTHDGRMDSLSSRFKNMILRKLFLKSWGKRRSLPVVKSKSFRQLWEERREKK